MILYQIYKFHKVQIQNMHLYHSYCYARIIDLEKIIESKALKFILLQLKENEIIKAKRHQRFKTETDNFLSRISAAHFLCLSSQLCM